MKRDPNIRAIVEKHGNPTIRELAKRPDDLDELESALARRFASTLGTNVIGYTVEALDGPIGKVDHATLNVEPAYIVIDTGPWIFGKQVMLPGGIIRGVDHDDEKIFVDRTRDEIKNAPGFDASLAQDEAYRERLISYYGLGGAGYSEPD